jgi:deoxyribodipyrimidine photo-lyase
MNPISVHWFRNDLRLEDNPALSLAASQNMPLVCLYIMEDDEPCVQNLWLHASLKALQASLKELKIPLVFAKGPGADVWKHLIKHHTIGHVTWSKCYEPDGIKRDAKVEKLLADIPVKTVNGTLLLEPTALSTGSGDFYKVFTPYWKLHQKVYESPKAAPRVKANASSPHIEILKLDDLNLMKHPLINLEDSWQPGEEGAHERLKHFLSHALSHYEKGRDYPAEKAHSGLSPHLHFGEISPHAIVRALHTHTKNSTAFIRELVFRDFAAQLLYHIPHLSTEPMKPQFSKWRWDNSSAFFDAWKKGKTGYPIVDAGMRELLETGFMHNRVRMIVASFLVKDLNVAWQKGADWFLKRLLDADLASNSFNWQWSAGTGPDAQPFFRIFNPLLQSTKFDPEGAYIRKWVPELKKLSNKEIHAPSDAARRECSYPSPLVDHDIAKKQALKEFHRVA